MSYKIEKAGYEYRGYKLGEKVLYNGQETMIIGFDENESTNQIKFIEVKFGIGSKYRIRDSFASTSVLDLAHDENCEYEWVGTSDITRLSEQKSNGSNTSEPRIENSQDELIIRIGKHTFYYNKSMDAFGMSACNEEVDNYDETVGLAVAYMRAMRRE